MAQMRMVLVALIVGCGARTGADRPPSAAGPRDGGTIDAGPHDGGRGEGGVADAGRDAGCAARPDALDADGDGFSVCGGDCDDGDPEVRPGRDEVCDGRDQDCDARIDEGRLSACGDCRPGCRLASVPGDDPWPVDADAAGVDVDDGGALVLSTRRTETRSAWIANYLFATVTRLDTDDGRQVAEYDSALLDGTNHAAPPGQECETEAPGGNCPSRTAVDLRGAVYVANRSFFGQGTITKIAGFESDCIDRDADGVIDTSRDVDGDGIIERDIPGEFLGQADECLLWTVDVGGRDGVPRALALDAAGTVWVGLHNERRALQLDPSDGHVLRTVDLPSTPLGGFRPYGAAADGAGRVWFVEAGSGTIVGLDAATGRLLFRETAVGRGAMGCSGSYGLAIDPEDRVWVAGFLCPYAFRFDPRAGRWREVALPESGITRGIAADASGRVYVASSHDWLRFNRDGSVDASEPVARVTVIDAGALRVERVYGTAAAPLPGRGSTGVSLDSAGALWLVNQDSSSATRLDLRTGVSREFPTGISPYTYSDFTGYALRTFTAPNGTLRTIVAGCAAGPTEWELVRWNARLPAGTRVELRVRTADTVAALSARPWIGPFATVPVTELSLPPGPVGGGAILELEVSLLSDGGAASPAIDDLVVQYNCP
jgi:outer membrane protein assembly factor BamB